MENCLLSVKILSFMNTSVSLDPYVHMWYERSSEAFFYIFSSFDSEELRVAIKRLKVTQFLILFFYSFYLIAIPPLVSIPLDFVVFTVTHDYTYG